jgi:chromosome segregation ATPase
MALMRDFVLEKLAGELAQVKEQAKALEAERAAIVAESAEHKAALEEAYTQRIKQIDEFTVRQVSKELREFQEDKRALVEKRVQLVAESRKKLAETQREFVATAAKMVDKQVTETLKAELTQLHEELEKNRQNAFGRRIFEAVAAEFMTSYFGESTEVKKMEAILESQKAEMEAMKQQLQESQRIADAASRKAKLAEEQAKRTQIMAELTGNLSREKKAVMEELLETVKTTQLRESFNKYLPAVLSEGSKKKDAPQSRQRTLTEAPVKELSTVAITGDQRTNRLRETVQAEGTEQTAVSDDTATILRLAGLKK